MISSPSKEIPLDSWKYLFSWESKFDCTSADRRSMYRLIIDRYEATKRTHDLSTQSVYFKLSLQSFYWWLPFQHCVQFIHKALASLCDSSTFLTHVWQFYISKYGCIKKLHKATPGCNVYDACQMVYLFTFGVTVDIHRKQRHVIGYQRQISQ